jgi:MoxR-vWA-beta-propeller ternary system domain bpX2
MPHELSQVGCASLPGEALSELGDLRRVPGLRVTLHGDRAWLEWPAGDDVVLRRVMPIVGSVLYVRRGPHWHRLGESLPTFGLPIDGMEPIPLDRAVVPQPIHPEPPAGSPPVPVSLRLERDDRPRPARALRCRLEPLAAWAELAPSSGFRGLIAAWQEDDVLVVGTGLPVVEGAERFWGNRVLIPLGYRPEPTLAEPALSRAMGIPEQSLALLTLEGVETIPLTALGPLSRAGVRLASTQGGAPR